MSPEDFLQRVEKSLAESDYTGFSLVGGPDVIVGRLDKGDYPMGQISDKIQAVLYSDLKTHEHESVLFVADTNPTDDRFEERLVGSMIALESTTYGYHIRGHLWKFKELGALTLLYPRG